MCFFFVSVLMSFISRESFHSCRVGPLLAKLTQSDETWWMRWADHAAWMGEMRNLPTILVGMREGKRPPWRIRLIVGIILKWVRCIWGCDMDSSCSGYVPVGGMLLAR